MTLNTTQREAAGRIAARQPFTAGSMHAELVRWTPSCGQLPAELVAELAADIETAREHGEETYVVFSYATPIAWTVLGDDLLVPEVRYSVTTSKHQAVCRRGA